MDNTHFFSFSRITMVMKREAVESRKKYLYFFIGFYAAFVILMVFNMWAMSVSVLPDSDPDAYFHQYCAKFLGFFMFIFQLGSLVYAAGILGNMKSKEARTSFLMLPATMIEKYVTRFLLVTLGFWVTVLVAFLLAEITRYVFLPLFYLPETFRQPILFDWVSRYIVGGERVIKFSCMVDPWLDALFGWTSIVWTHSLYILGGSYWHKNAFFKTLGTLIVLFVLGVFCMVQVAAWIGEDGLIVDRMIDMKKWMEVHFQWVTLNHILTLEVAFFSFFTMFNWWLGYKLFTRSQVIKPKFRLL